MTVHGKMPHVISNNYNLCTVNKISQCTGAGQLHSSRSVFLAAELNSKLVIHIQITAFAGQTG
ncbi:hypothetical protein A4R26_23875 [Niastella populi]|uniref:Uncharacterized protein n=1 Tax=Niastella populi TaxID=550983 RepID=A0A1V9FGS5_9BACT|nr:hypothetical protein A4R26_23875 [Niastella populi]